MSIVKDEADFLREVIAEAMTAPMMTVGIKTSDTAPREMWPATWAIVIGGFAVHRTTGVGDELWTVTHIATGLAAGTNFDSLWDALVAVGIYHGSGAPWHEIKSAGDVKRLVDRESSQRIKAAIERLPLTVDFVGEVAPEGKPADD